MTLRARPTMYGGVQMKSRLEATYAASLDRIGWPWRYEPRAYGALGHRQYLPDFEVLLAPDLTLLVEVRPSLEGGYRAMEQMAVIWENDPDARLVIVTPTVTWMADGTDRRWQAMRAYWGAE